MDLGTVTGLRSAADRSDLALRPGETLLAGGTWLFSETQPGVTGLVDLTALAWPATEPLDDGLRIGATCTIAQLVATPATVLGAAHELVQRCAEAFLMSFKVQHVATVGGNLCLALPAGAMISLTAGLGGVAVIWQPDGGERRLPVADFVHGVQSTDLRPGEVLRAVDLTAEALASRTAFRSIALSPLGRSSSVVVGRLAPDGSPVLTVTAATTRPVVLTLPTGAGPDDLSEALASVDTWYDDPHGPADWRAGVTATLAGEVLEELTT